MIAQVSPHSSQFEGDPETEHPARQAFHWVGHDGRAAVEEIARVLKPGGVWALIWNLEDRDVPWIAQIREKYEQFEQGAAASRRS